MKKLCEAIAIGFVLAAVLVVLTPVCIAGFCWYFVKLAFKEGMKDAEVV